MRDALRAQQLLDELGFRTERRSTPREGNHHAYSGKVFAHSKSRSTVRRIVRALDGFEALTFGDGNRVLDWEFDESKIRIWLVDDVPHGDDAALAPQRRRALAWTASRGSLREGERHDA